MWISIAHLDFANVGHGHNLWVELIDVCIYIHVSSRIGLTASYPSIRRQ